MFLPGLLLELTKTEETLKSIKSLFMTDSLDAHIKACQDARNTIICLGDLAKCSYCDCKDTCLFKERKQVKEAREMDDLFHPN